MPDATEQQDKEDQASSVTVPQESQEEEQMDDDRAEARDDDDPQEPREPLRPLEPQEVILQGFRTVSQTLSEAYGKAGGEIQILVWKNLVKATTKDRNFMYGASQSIRHWVDCVKLAMALSEQSTEEQTKLLADARQAGKDALDNISNFIPVDEDPPKLDPIFPKTNQLLAPTLVVTRKHTDEALRNVHIQLSDLIREHVPSD